MLGSVFGREGKCSLLDELWLPAVRVVDVLPLADSVLQTGIFTHTRDSPISLQ